MPYWLRTLRDCVFPAGCEVCDAPLGVGHPASLCAQCLETMRPLCPPLCGVCGVPLPLAAGIRCAGCTMHPPAFTTAHAAALYLPAPASASPLAVAIHALNYRRRRIVAQPPGPLLAGRYPYIRAALLVPARLHL